tara:strand:+ start:71 stop:1066 length:996 start_codon:yes stop_codon:yes gene_type:complete
MKRIFVLIVVVLVFLSGCTADESTDEVELVSSYNGMVTTPYAGSLPSSVYEGESISMQFLVENQGDYDVESGDYFLKIKGINPGALGLSSDDLQHSSTRDMNSISSFGDETIVSGQEVIDVSMSACYNNDLENDLTLNIHAKSCYKYGTISSASVCFVKISGTGDGICSPSEYKSVTNTIAPVVVTELAQSPAGETDDGNTRHRFRVKVQNMGPGTVFDTDVEINSCDENLPHSDENVIYIDNIKLDGVELDSSTLIYEGGVIGGDSASVPSFRLGSTDSAGRFSFIIEQDSDIEFVGDLDIEMSYAYTQTDVFSTTINALPDQEPNCPTV